MTEMKPPFTKEEIHRIMVNMGFASVKRNPNREPLR